MFSEAEIKKRKEEIVAKRLLWQTEMEKIGARPVGEPVSSIHMVGKSIISDVGPMTYIRKAKAGDYFMLYTQDRTACITEEFLGRCAPFWAQELREAMANWS